MVEVVGYETRRPERLNCRAGVRGALWAYVVEETDELDRSRKLPTTGCFELRDRVKIVSRACGHSVRPAGHHASLVDSAVLDLDNAIPIDHLGYI